MWIIFVSLVVLFTLGVPVAWSMALSTIIYIVVGTPLPLLAVAQRMVGGIDSFTLLSIPFFILAGNLMNTGGITDRLVTFSKVLVGHITGGLSHVVVVTNMVMAGMSGSSLADAAGSGTVLIPAMKRAGYPVPYAAAVVASAATIGPIIPPSIPFVVYGSLASVSVGRLFLAGAIPGILMGLILIVSGYVISKRRHYPSEPRAACGELLRATLHALPPMGMPIIILGGILAGVATPTEAAVAGVMYAFVLGFFVYRELTLQNLPKILLDSVTGTASIVIIISAAVPFGWVLTYEQAPIGIVTFFQNLALEQWQVYAILNVLVLIAGLFMEGTAIMIMAVPILLPLLKAVEIDLIHFGVVFVVNMMIGQLTPPVGMLMYLVCGIGNISMVQFAKEVWPFLLALIAALLLVTYVPDLALWLPRTLMGAQ